MNFAVSDASLVGNMGCFVYGLFSGDDGDHMFENFKLIDYKKGSCSIKMMPTSNMMVRKAELKSLELCLNAYGCDAEFFITDHRRFKYSENNYVVEKMFKNKGIDIKRLLWRDRDFGPLVVIDKLTKTKNRKELLDAFFKKKNFLKFFGLWNGKISSAIIGKDNNLFGIFSCNYIKDIHNLFLEVVGKIQSPFNVLPDGYNVLNGHCVQFGEVINDQIRKSLPKNFLEFYV